MNNRRSYLDSINAGRRRRASTSLEDIATSLNELETRLRRPYEDRDDLYRQQPTRETRPEQHGRASRDDRTATADLSSELNALRRDLRDQMGSGLRREFTALKQEIEDALQRSGPASQTADLRTEFERLSGMIHKLAEQSDDRQVNMLRLEMEQVKNALGKLAREDTVQSFDRRWSEFDQRWSNIATQVANAGGGTGDDPALRALSARLEQIGEAVNALPTSVALRSLEDKMKILATTVDQFAHQQDRIGPEALDAIEERLDEISRAVAASSGSSRASAFDPEPFERIEARISALARQLDESAGETRSDVLVDQIAALSTRVEDIAHRVDLPEQVIERLAERIDTISYKLDQGPAQPDMDQVFRGLEDRFASISTMLEQRHEDSVTQGQLLFRDLERRLESVAARLDSSGRDAAHDARFIEAMDARFADLAARLEQQPPAPADEQAIRSLEARMDTMSSRLESSLLQPGIDKDLIRSLESQISDLASHLSSPAPTREDDDIRPRLDKIEQSIVESRRDVIEAARQAAEETVRRFSGAGNDGPIVAGLVDDLKSLEALTRKSDDRNAKTFEAIHDTLLKIVGRLGTIEAGANEPQAAAPQRQTLLDADRTPSLEPSNEALPMAATDETPTSKGSAEPARGARRTAAAAAAQAAADALRGQADGASAKAGSERMSMLGGLTRALSGRKAGTREDDRQKLAGDAPDEKQGDDAVPSVEVDTPLDPALANQPLEPGSGAPDLNAIMKRVRDERGQPPKSGADVDTAKADFIAAARRAAQAAAAEAEIMKRRPASKSKSGGFSLGGLIKRRRKPVLMGIAAILIALAGLQIGRTVIGGGNDEAVAEAPEPTATSMPLVSEAVEPESVEDAPEQTVRVAGESVPDSARSMMAEPPQTAEEVTTDWLDADSATSLPEVAEEPQQEVAPAESQAVHPLEETAQAETAATEVASMPEADEEAVAAIPADAGPVALREAAAAGDPKALYEIGNRYAEGRGTPEDMAKAAEWYQKAADQGLAPAQYRIGNLHEKGVGVERDVKAAKTWYQLAAAQGNASAMHNLAVLHAMGADGTTDNDSAARWFAEAAEFGVKDSQFNLGILSAKGVGMKQNLEEAYKWFALVAQAGDKDAADKRDEVAKALRPEQLENARAAVELWRAKPVDPEANTVEVPDSWSEGAEVTASVDMKQAVRNIQAILNKNGYEAGPADGVMGAKTKTAIAAFQRDNGMNATGEVDEATVHALLERR